MAEKKTIAFYCSSLTKGGAERVFANLAEYFTEKGYTVYMVTQYKQEDEYCLKPGIRCHSCSTHAQADTPPGAGSSPYMGVYRSFSRPFPRSGSRRRIWSILPLTVCYSSFQGCVLEQ